MGTVLSLHFPVLSVHKKANAGNEKHNDTFSFPPKPSMLLKADANNIVTRPRSDSSPYSYHRPINNDLSVSRERVSSCNPPEFRHIKSVAVVDYTIRHGDSPYAVFRVEGHSTSQKFDVYRRYNHFYEFHKSLRKSFDPSMISSLKLPGKRFLKLNKFDANDMEERRIALDTFMRALVEVEELACSRLLFDFLGETWKRTDEWVPRQAPHPLDHPSPPRSESTKDPFNFNATSNQTPTAHVTSSQSLSDIDSSSSTDSKSDNDESDSESTEEETNNNTAKSPYTNIYPSFTPSSGPSPLQPPMRRRRALELREMSPIIKRVPLNLGKKRVWRKLPLPVFDLDELSQFSPARLPKVITLGREFDTERAYVSRGTPRRPGIRFVKSRERELPKPPDGFFDVVFPSEDQITKQRAFLKEFYRRRFETPKPHINNINI